jgi:syndetin
LEIKELINNQDYSLAIILTNECEKSISKYDHYKCIVDLKLKIHNYIERIEQHLERSCTQVCQNYNHILYKKIVDGYTQLDKLDIFIDKLNLNIITTINHVASDSLIQFLTKKTTSAAKQINENDLQQKEFSQLCTLIPFEDYRKLLLTLSCSMWKVMKIYYQMYMWHHNYYYQQQQQQLNQKQKEQSTLLNDKFHQGFNRLWQDVQHKISICFGAMCFDTFKFDDFIEMLTIINRIIKYGQEYCIKSSNQNKNVDCSILIKATKQQTLAYFKAFHLRHLEELKMFLENEIWQWCPVKSNFSIFKLQVSPQLLLHLFIFK